MNQPTDEQRELASILFDKYMNSGSDDFLDMVSAWDNISDQIADSVVENELEAFMIEALVLGIQYGTNLAAELFASTPKELASSNNTAELELMQKIIQDYRYQTTEIVEFDDNDNELNNVSGEPKE